MDKLFMIYLALCTLLLFIGTSVLLFFAWVHIVRLVFGSPFDYGEGGEEDDGSAEHFAAWEKECAEERKLRRLSRRLGTKPFAHEEFS